MNSVERWAEAIAEPLLADESLRGDLEDAAYQPILDWAMLEAGRCAAVAAAREDAPQFAQACRRQLRSIVFAVSRAAVDGQREDLLALIGPPVFGPPDVPRVRVGLGALALTDDARTNAERLAAALAPAPEEER
ncbi:MAG: hypothetical protein M0Z94_12935 [Dehalococcoidales bacterium]|nr:hypothetical protein [Dehalococcoidales bacterium]